MSFPPKKYVNSNRTWFPATKNKNGDSPEFLYIFLPWEHRVEVPARYTLPQKWERPDGSLNNKEAIFFSPFSFSPSYVGGNKGQEKKRPKKRKQERNEFKDQSVLFFQLF